MAKANAPYSPYSSLKCQHDISIFRVCKKCRDRSVKAGRPADNSDRYFPYEEQSNEGSGE